MTNPVPFTKLHPVDATIDATVEIIDAEEVVTGTETKSVVKRPPDSTAITQEFLVCYSNFVGAPIEGVLLWETQAFHAYEKAPSDSNPWLKVGCVGVGGLATIAGVNALFSKNPVQPVIQAAQVLLPNLSPKSSVRPSRSPRIPATATVGSGAFMPEFSGSAQASNALLPKINVAPVISPAIRAPLPAQVIRQQQAGLVAGLGSPVSNSLARLAQPRLAPSLPSKKLAALNQRLPKKRALVQRPVAMGSVARSKVQKVPSRPVLDSLPRAVPESSQRVAPVRSTPMPPNQPIQNTAPLPLLTPNPAVIQSPEPLVSQLPKATVVKEQNGTAPSKKRQVVISAVVAPSLTQEINTAQTIQDFLQLSQKIPSESKIAILSLTPQAAIAVPNTPKLAEFQVFRLPTATYQKVWMALTQAKEQEVPNYGFIDYQQKAIILPAS